MRLCIWVSRAPEVVQHLNQIFFRVDVRIIFRSESRLNTFIETGKDPLDCLNRKNVIYLFSCICGKCYIGQTKRPLRIRRKEHIDNFKLNEKYPNVICKHLKDNDTTVHSFQ